MRPLEYQNFCKKTAKKFNSKEKEIFTWGLGIAGEAGDVAGCEKLKKRHPQGFSQKSAKKQKRRDWNERK